MRWRAIKKRNLRDGPKMPLPYDVSYGPFNRDIPDQNAAQKRFWKQHQRPILKSTETKEC
jgi:hypothetical protein